MSDPRPAASPQHEPRHEPHRPDPRVPTSNPVLARVLLHGALLALAIAVVGAVVGFLTVGWTGVAGALVGTGMAVVFLGVTAASILLANRFAGSDLFVGAFFGIVLGSWIVKFVAFIILLFALKGQPWLDPTVTFLCLIAGVIGSLTVDVVVIARSRIPYASDVALPGEKKHG